MARRILCAILLSAGVSAHISGGVIDNDHIMARGDATNNGTVDMGDATYILNHIYQGGPAPPCLNQADANNSGTVDQSDAVYLLNWLFQGGSAPPAPGPHNTTCGHDDSPFPGCGTAC